MNLTVTVPYEDYQKLTQAAADKENVVKILNTTFPDATCQLIAIKSILEITTP